MMLLFLYRLPPRFGYGLKPLTGSLLVYFLSLWTPVLLFVYVPVVSKLLRVWLGHGSESVVDPQCISDLMLVVYSWNPGLAVALNRKDHDNNYWNTFISRQCSPFTCTVSVHQTYADIQKGYQCSTLSNFMGYTIILTIYKSGWMHSIPARTRKDLVDDIAPVLTIILQSILTQRRCSWWLEVC